jgi:hypothetical protein
MLEIVEGRCVRGAMRFISPSPVDRWHDLDRRADQPLSSQTGSFTMPTALGSAAISCESNGAQIGRVLNSVSKDAIRAAFRHRRRRAGDC